MGMLAQHIELYRQSTRIFIIRLHAGIYCNRPQGEVGQTHWTAQTQTHKDLANKKHVYMAFS